jgi:hypothetical protein
LRSLSGETAATYSAAVGPRPIVILQGWSAIPLNARPAGRINDDAHAFALDRHFEPIRMTRSLRTCEGEFEKTS